MDTAYKQSSNIPLIIFLSISFLVLLSIGQNEVIDRGSIYYWLIILPALILPLTKIHYITYNVFTKTWPLLLMLVFSFMWGLINNDLHAVLRVALFLIVLSWLEVNSVSIKVNTMIWLYVSSIVIAVCIYISTDINHWGLIPGTTDADFGIWRISFFPNIANTGFFSLFMFMLVTKDRETFDKHKGIALLSLYFIIFSFVRSAVLSLFAYLIFRFIFNNIKNTKVLFLSTLVFALILNYVVGYAAEIIHTIQSIPLVNRVLLRGEYHMSQHEIYVQMYRPWVWQNQWNIFMNSPLLMGEGQYNFNEYISSSIRGSHFEETDSVSLLLGMLASYGLAALFFFYYLLKKVYRSAMDSDTWACAVFPIIIFIAMQWGSIFHPASATFIIFFLILVKGKKGFH